MLSAHMVTRFTSWSLVGSLLLASVQSWAAERYVISLEKSQLQFKAYALLVRPLGTFRTFSGDIVADAENLSASWVRMVIETRSIDTGNAKRDTHLRSEDFLFVEQYPTITFTSTGITGDGPDYVAQGDLRMRGVTRRITIPVTVEQRQGAIIVRGRVRLHRKDFGINYNAFFNPIRNVVDVMFTMVGLKP